MSSVMIEQGHYVASAYGVQAEAMPGIPLLQRLHREPLTHVGVTCDESLTSSFRNAFCPDYKANRALPPPDLAWQLQQCQAVARTLGLQMFVDQFYEADDLIGTLAVVAGCPWRCQEILQYRLIFLSYLFSITYGKISAASMVQCQKILQSHKFLITTCFFVVFAWFSRFLPHQCQGFLQVTVLPKLCWKELRSIN
jgi:hypothetical protein